ncbi:toll/interleukin-1 receptor domain-containing protein [Streptomyces sp. RerS4]|uniref:toll/interleukin-1 receptor domain-containing protein n=1 Tax=Streptomyces sp. RerS4 TaxID=2942449 RepID=UPI00201C2926|nr:toll/interleukin-1 receptor domain-containing protein [Streptomyces sp. RerS4]UQX02994.1 toll/interleukin-1 receptor domain-containing protein [Streptomyces sp. RerS4]
MPEIFVNYRTGDEEATATLIERELSRRFGDDRVFRASKSIRPGQAFPRELLTAVRRSSVLLAVIGEKWVTAPGRSGRPALEDPQDWTRVEIREAIECGAHVVPVLVGRSTRLERGMLPAELAELADHQYRRFDHRNAESDLRRLGDDLAELVPRLAGADRTPPQAGTDTDADPTGATRMRVRDIRHEQRGGIGFLNGNLDSFISEPNGPIHTGSGAQYNGPSFNGEGMGVNFVAGDNSGGMRQYVESADDHRTPRNRDHDRDRDHDRAERRRDEA